MSPQLYHRLDEIFCCYLLRLKCIVADATDTATTVIDAAAAATTLCISPDKVVIKHNHSSIIIRSMVHIHLFICIYRFIPHVQSYQIHQKYFIM